MPNSEEQKRFWSFVRKPNDPMGCWEWNGYKNPKGYGLFTASKKSVRAHRFSFELAQGKIGSGLFVCHRCDNPSCVNPDHLWVGTAKENSEDAKSKGRQAKGTRCGASVLTEPVVMAIRARYASGSSQRSLSREFGIAVSHVNRIVRRTLWAHLSPS